MKKIILAFVVIAICILPIFLIDDVAIYQANQQINIENIKIFTSEEEVIRNLGKGEYIYGMGGYGREYGEKGLTLGFSSDSDNDAYRKVATIETENVDHSIHGIHVGDKVTKLHEVLNKKGYTSEKNSHYYTKREIHIGYSQANGFIDKLRVWFTDKDLEDRIY